MTNFERFFSDLINTDFGLLDGKPIACCNVSCVECAFRRAERCSAARMEWLKREYTEHPKISIPDNTLIDAKVFVSDSGKDWVKRHYAGCVDGVHYAWSSGRTSWSTNPSDKIPWKYMKLYNEE